MEKKKPVIGILGGIASGKSSVASEFARHGCAVIDADQIVHELLERPDIKLRLVQAFGTEILTEDRINRSKVGEIIFSDPVKVEKINSIVHPEVMKRTETLIEQYKNAPEISAVVLDVPLLAEVGWTDRCDFLVFVECDEEKRVKRFTKKSGRGVEELKKREKFQISLDKKARMAHYMVSNNSDLSAVAEQVAQIFSKMGNNKASE